MIAGLRSAKADIVKMYLDTDSCEESFDISYLNSTHVVIHNLLEI